MRTFCVDSHHKINGAPLLQQGVMLNPDMLQPGIWFPAGATSESYDDHYRQDFKLQRSENQAEYTAALRALLGIHNDNQHFMAVVSMRWCTLTNRLVTAKRVWLSIFHGTDRILTFSHTKDGRDLHNFTGYWREPPEPSQIVWEDRFNSAILDVMAKKAA
jgi:hypothetical protein